MTVPPPTRSLSAADLSADEMYLLLRDSVMPRPIAWVSTIDPQGRANLSPYSFFNVCSADPPVVGFSVGGKARDARGQPQPKDTLANIRATGDMVVNIVPESMILPMVATAAALPPGDSEFEHAKLPSAPSTRVGPPRVAGAPVAFECSVYSILEIGTSWWVMGRVEHVHVDERVYVGPLKGLDHRVDLLRDEAMRPVGRLGRALYVRLREIETVLRPDGPND
jgi:flavin reductase (DIM6/NTAB) family NADH-FMN oxidoreductase RutF